ncbi:MAG TPA: FAD-dependent oxidoreductase [Polyangiales bacterium]|nr:FAD-dependent oxidoreductase [Polyangiales bacterium]
MSTSHSDHATSASLLERPRRLRDQSRWDASADVVIIGGGAAGASAAIEARRLGADVLILERAGACGGSTALSGGILYFGGGTEIQTACGFSDSADEMYKYLLAASGPNPDAEKVQLYCERNLEHFAWCKDQGLRFNPRFYAKKTTEPPGDDGLLYSGNENVWPFNEIAVPAPRGHKPATMGSAGGVIMEALLSQATRHGVRFQYDTRAVGLVVDDEGRVAGVIARESGAECAVRARRGVILCAGGFVMNREMLAQHAPKLLNVNVQIGNPGDDGAGILLGLSAGGYAIGMGEGFVSVPFYPPSKLVHGVIVNVQGQRFVNEDAYHGRTGDFILRQSGAAAYLIVDEPHFGRPIAGMQLKAAGETLEILERELALPESSLVNTLRFYNEHARIGKDPLFHKAAAYLTPLEHGPFAALDLSAGRAIVPGFTMGGLDTLPTGEVLGPDRNVVRGLYAAGRNSCGLPRSAAGYSSGMSIGCATFFGRLAGISAARADTIGA